MRHWKEGVVAGILVILVVLLVPIQADNYFWNTSYGDWSVPGNWIPLGPPSAGDDAYIGSLQAYSQAYLSSNATVANLHITNNFTGSAWVWTHGYRLVVLDTTYLTETSSSKSVSLIVATGGVGNDFDTNYLNITGGAELNMQGGVAQIDNQLKVDADSYIIGHGAIDFNSSDPYALSLAGTLRVSGGGTLTLQVTSGGKLDLDGSSGGNSIIDVTYGSSRLVVNGELSDAFNGTMTIGEGNRAEFAHAWTHEGTLNFNAGSSTATLMSAPITVNGTINVSSGTGYISSDVDFNASATVNIASGATLRLDSGQTTYKGGSYTGAGTLSQDDIAVIAEDTTINTSYYDWDGAWGTSQTTVNSGKTFTINSSIADVHNGTITVNGGKIIVNNPWSMAGTLNLTSNGNVLDGARMTLTSSGTMNCTNYPLIYAPVTIAGTVTASPSIVFRGDTIFESTATVNLAAGEYINLYGTTTYRGGTFSGDGFIRQNGDATIEADTTIGVSTFDLDGVFENATTTINPGVAFTLNVDDIEFSDNDGFDGTVNIQNGATLAVNTPGSWTLEGQINLMGGQVTGSIIINDGTISGFGTVAADYLNNNGTLSADGGTLVLDTTTFPDLDGSLETGLIEAINGDVHVKGDFGGLFVFNTQLIVGQGHEFRMDYYGLNNCGEINLRGGTYVSPRLANRSGGRLVVDTAPATLESDSTFYSGSTTTLNTDLYIDGSLTVNSGATVTGPAELIIKFGSTLQGNGTVDVDVINRGQFSPATSVGIFTINGDYAQASVGKLETEIGGLIPGMGHDQVRVSGSAELAGGLLLPVIGGYEPDYYDEFEIIEAGSVVDHFDWIKGVAAFPDKYLAVVYNANNVLVVAALPGDANLDHSVDVADLGVLASNYGTSDNTWAQGDFNGDGVVGLADLGILSGNYGSSVDSAVPEPMTLVLICVAAVPVLIRRRRN